MVPGIHFSNVFYFRCSTDVLLTFSSMYHDWCSACPPRKKQGWIMCFWSFSIVQLDFFRWKQKTHENFSVSFRWAQTQTIGRGCEVTTVKTISSMESILAVRSTNKHLCMVCLTRHGLFGYWSWGIYLVKGPLQHGLFQHVSTSEIRKSVMLRAC